MKTSLAKPVMLGLGLAHLGVPAGMADEGQGKSPSYVLETGDEFATPGAMFQYLRTRDDGLATGNPKAIVDAYPDEFETVGDLIHQKREAAE